MMQSTTHVMIDLETYGQGPGCGLVSLGAVAFSQETGLGKEFYSAINRNSCLAAGLREDQATLDWWAKQPPISAQILLEADKLTTPVLPDVLVRFHNWLCDLGPVGKTTIWGNGADFDPPILATACLAVGLQQPWRPYMARCYRTIKNLDPMCKILRGHGEAHTALGDAMNQAVHLLELARRLQLTLG